MARGKRIQKVVVTGRATLPLAILLAIACGTVSGVLLSPGIDRVRAGDYPLWDWFDGLGLSWGANAICALLVYGLVGYLLVLLNNVYAIIRMRASAQTALFLLMVAACPGVHQRLHVGCLVSVLMLLSLYYLFRSYQQQRPEGNLTHAFLFLGLGSLLYPQLTWLTPVLWIGSWIFRSLTFRSFLGSILGWSLPYWFLFCYAYFSGEMEHFWAPLQEIIHIRPLAYSLRPETLATLGYLLVLLLASTVHCLMSGLEDGIRTRCYLQFFILFSFCMLGYMALQPIQGVLVLPVLLIGISFLAAHLFVLTDNRVSNVFFIMMIAGLFVLCCYNVWSLMEL